MSAPRQPLILVAEDDRITRMKLGRFLERELGARVLAAEDGDQAWQLYEQNPEIQFVISDYMMPNCTGAELCQRIRGLGHRRYTYIILLTGRTEKDDLISGMSAGADEYLTKPFDPSELSLRVRAGLRILELEEKLATQNRRLEDAYNSLEQAVQAATKVQRNLLPEMALLADLEGRHGIRINYEYIVCENLGGDIIGVVEPAPGQIAVFIADVSGHGIAASMAAVSLNSFLRTLLRESPDPLWLVSQANRFCSHEFPAEVYATMAYMLITPAKHQLSLVVAGHPPVLKLNAHGQFSEYLSTIPPLGLWNDDPEPDCVVELSLEPGDRLVAYTDGVIETRNAAGIFFAKEWLTTSIVKSALSKVGTVPGRIVADLNAWRGEGVPAEDDITIMSLQML